MGAVAAAAITPLVGFGVHDGRLGSIYLMLLGVFVLGMAVLATHGPRGRLGSWEA